MWQQCKRTVPDINGLFMVMAFVDTAAEASNVHKLCRVDVFIFSL